MPTGNFFGSGGGKGFYFVPDLLAPAPSLTGILDREVALGASPKLVLQFLQH